MTESAQTVAANGGIFRDLLDDFETLYGADLLGATVMRIRGSVVADQSYVVGIRVMTQSMVNQLVSGTHDPNADQHADWMLYTPVFVTTSATREPVNDIDVRSSRKIDELGQGLLLAVSNLSGTASSFSYHLSVGLKLP